MQPIILFSHIPLSHPETKSCGPLREQGTIRRGVGVGYQNTIGKQTTEFLLESLRPAAVFRHVLVSGVIPSSTDSVPTVAMTGITVNTRTQ